MNNLRPERKPPPTLWEYLKAGFIAAHRRRPLSFYLLMLIPVVLLLSAHVFHGPVSIQRFILVLALILLFLWLVCAWAVIDFFHLWRKHAAEKRRAYLQTIGDPEFAERLGKCVRKRQNPLPPLSPVDRM